MACGKIEKSPLPDTNPIADPSSSSGLLDIVDWLKRRHNKADVVRGVGVVAPRNDGGRVEPHRPVRGEAHWPDLILHPLTFHLNGLISRGGLDDVRLQRLIHRQGDDVSKVRGVTWYYAIFDKIGETSKVRTSSLRGSRWTLSNRTGGRSFWSGRTIYN